MYRLGQVASKLNLTPGLVQRWTRDYETWLSDEATILKRGANGRYRPRRYSDEDVALLQRLKVLDAQGLSPHEISERLSIANGNLSEAVIEPIAPPPEAETASVPAQSDPLDAEEPPPISESGDIVSYESPSAAIQLLQQTMESHQELVRAQEAQRDLLNAMFERATTLKNENSQLRKRLRMMEEQMTRLKESDWTHRLTLEERMAQLEQELADAQSKRSWWQRLFDR